MYVYIYVYIYVCMCVCVCVCVYLCIYYTANSQSEKRGAALHILAVDIGLCTRGAGARQVKQ
jgi:hypothetical protein